MSSWMTAKKLQLNDNKTEAMIILSNRMSVHSPLPSVIHIGDADVPFVSSVKNLGVTLDSNLSMSQHISNTCKAAYIQIRHISSIRHLLTTQATQTLVCSLVLSCLDYCNSLLSVSLVSITYGILFSNRYRTRKMYSSKEDKSRIPKCKNKNRRCQCRVSRIGWMWMWSDFLALHTSLAAAFWTFWSLSSKHWNPLYYYYYLITTLPSFSETVPTSKALRSEKPIW